MTSAQHTSPGSARPSRPSRVGTISTEQHLDFLAGQRSASFLQTPAWASVKSEWRAESIGWHADDDTLIGAGLVLYRQLPKLKRYLAYLPEGPCLDWSSQDLSGWLQPMVAHLKQQGAFGIRMGPPVLVRTWAAKQVKDGVADPAVATLGQLAPTHRDPVGSSVTAQLREAGWIPQSVSGGFAAGQPQFNFQIPLRDADGNARTEADVLASMNQLWRRNIKKATKAGVEVTMSHDPGELAAFHEVYVETAKRDHFTPRPLGYFTTMVEALNSQPEVSELRLYFAHHEGDLVASTIWIRVGGHTWYSYGASTTAKRDVRGSNAIQWRMICDALAADADVYDLRGITDTLDPDDSHVGLIQFKVGTGGEAVEYVGEWDLPVNKALYKAFDLYMSRR